MTARRVDTRTPDDVPAQTRANVLKLISLGRDAEWVGIAMQLPPALVKAIAAADGPDKASMQRAIAVLEAPPAEAPARLSRPSGPSTSSTSTPPAAAAAGAGSPSVAPRPAPPARGPRFLRVAIGSVMPDPDNPRESVGDITELAASMRDIGMLQPIVARPAAAGRWMVVAGHRRLAAAQTLGWQHVELVVRELLDDDVLAAMLIENGQRRDLDPIEEARALKRIHQQMGLCPVEAVAKRVGRSVSHVHIRLSLLSLSPADQDAIRSGALTVTAGAAKARVTSGRVRPGAAGRSGSGHLSASHRLADRVMARCTRLKHSRGKGVGVGGVGCGNCWETVIRADEREQLHTAAATRGSCPLCDQPNPEGGDDA